MVFLADEWEYQPAGTRDTAKTTSFFDSIKALVKRPAVAVASALDSKPANVSSSLRWVDDPTGRPYYEDQWGNYSYDGGNTWSNSYSSPANRSLPPDLLALPPGGDFEDPQFGARQQWLNQSNEGRSGSRYDRMGFQEAPTNSALLGYYDDQQARQQTLSQILGFADKAANAITPSKPTYSLPPLDISLNEVAANSRPADTGWGAAGRVAGGFGGALKSGYDKYYEKFGTPLAETGAQLTGPMLKFHDIASRAGVGIPGVAPAIAGVTALTGWKPDATGGMGQLAGSIKESGGSPLRFSDIQNRKFAERPVAQQMLASTAYDITNLAGAGAGAAALKSGAVTSKLGRGLATADKALDVAQTKAALPLIGGVAGYAASATTGGDTKDNLIAAAIGAAGATLAPSAFRKLRAELAIRAANEPALARALADVMDRHGISSPAELIAREETDTALRADIAAVERQFPNVMPSGAMGAGLPVIPQTNYRTDLSDFTDTLYHETSPEAARFLIPGTGSMTTPGDMYFSNTPELALGQSGRGVLIEYAAPGIEGQINRSKPGWEHLWDQGQAEFVARSSNPSRNIVAVTLSPEAMASSGGRRVKEALVDWVPTSQSDGTVRFQKPESGKPKLLWNALNDESGAAYIPSIGEIGKVAGVGAKAATKVALPLIGGVVGGVGAAAMGEDWRGGALAGVAAGALAPALVKPVGKLTHGGFGGSVIEDVGRQGDMFGGSVPNPHLAGISPEVDAARKQLLGNLQQNRIIRKEGTTGDEIATGRTQQVSGILGGLSQGEAAGLTGRELLDSMANGIQGGPLIQTTAGPLQLTPDIQDDMADIVTAWVKQDPAGRAYEARTARDVLDKIYAGRMPEPKEDELLRRIFGDEVTDAISGSSRSLPVIKPDSEATSYPLDLGDQTVAVQPPLFGESGYSAPVKFTPEQRAIHDAALARQAEEKAYWDEVVAERRRQEAAAAMDKFRASGETAGAPLEMGPQGTQMSLYEAQPVTASGRFPATGEIIRPHSLTPKKILDMAKIVGLEIVSAPRALKSSLDLSAPLRQGAILGWRNPKLAKEAFAAQLKAWRSEGGARAIDKLLNERPNARIHRESGLYRAALNSMDDGLTAQEEVFVSRFADKLPYVKNSERAYATYLNKLRADSFDAIWNSLPELEKSSQRAKDLASFINVASGRGELTGRLAGSGPLLGTILYAPRYLVSRPQAVWMAATKTGIRGEATRALASYFAGTSTVLALGNAAGIWDVELDPRSSDFGKARIGPLRYDLWTGYSQLGRLMTQLSLAVLEPLDGKSGIRIPNASKSTETGDTRDISAGQPISRFARSKLAPGTGFLTNLVTQKDYRGSPYDPSIDMPGLSKKFDTGIGALVELAGPLSPTDFITAWNDYGWEMALATLPSFVGAGASVFDPTPLDALDKIAKQTEYADKDGNIVKGAKFYDLPAGTQARIKEENPELAKKLDDSKTSAEAKANVAATRILMEQQAKADSALEKGDLSPKEWREQLGARQKELITRKDQIYVNAGKKQGDDPVLDGYFDAIKKATDELGQTDWGKVEAFKAGLSDSEQKYLDVNTGLSLRTAKVKEYRAAASELDKSGYWDTYDRAWADYQKAYPETKAAASGSFNEWYDTMVKSVTGQLVASGTNPKSAKDEAIGLVEKTETYKAFDANKTKLRDSWVIDHKDDGIAELAWEWEYITANKYRKFLFGN